MCGLSQSLCIFSLSFLTCEGGLINSDLIGVLRTQCSEAPNTGPAFRKQLKACPLSCFPRPAAPLPTCTRGPKLQNDLLRPHPSPSFICFWRTPYRPLGSVMGGCRCSTGGMRLFWAETTPGHSWPIVINMPSAPAQVKRSFLGAGSDTAVSPPSPH